MYLPCRGDTQIGALQKVFLINEEEHLQNQREELLRDDQSSYRLSSPPMSLMHNTHLVGLCLCFWYLCYRMKCQKPTGYIMCIHLILTQ